MLIFGTMSSLIETYEVIVKSSLWFVTIFICFGFPMSRPVNQYLQNALTVKEPWN